jgi:hypothetical protein
VSTAALATGPHVRNLSLATNDRRRPDHDVPGLRTTIHAADLQLTHHGAPGKLRTSISLIENPEGEMTLNPPAVRQPVRKWIARLAILATAAGLLVGTATTQAEANAFTPSGCRQYAYGFYAEWRFNCTLGENGSSYINFAAYVQGTQIILAGFGYYTIGIDGDFGPGTYTGVRLFQNLENLTSDGIVGKNTWTALYYIPGS